MSEASEFRFDSGATYSSPLPKHPPSPQPTRNETIQIPLLSPIHALLNQQEHLVECDELGEVERVGACGSEDGADR